MSQKNLVWRALFQETDLSSKLMCQDPTIEVIEFNFNLKWFGNVTVTAKPAVPLGTNFMSDVFIVTANVQSVDHTSFVKVLPSNPSRVAAGFIGGSYHREYAIYKQWFNELTALRSSNSLNSTDIPLNVAKAHYVHLSLSEDKTSLLNDTVFSLEELKSKNYRMSPQAKKLEGIDLTHAQLAMETYANYHALSIANMRKFKKDDMFSLPEEYQVFLKDPNYIHPSGVYRSIVLPSYVKILRHLEKNETADWLEGLIPQLDEIWDWSFHLTPTPLTCIIHGDSWSNNIMYRYPENGETPDQMMLIDWQISRCSHPYIDLAYFFFSSTSSEFRAKYFDELIEQYFTTLNSALEKLNIHLKQEGYCLDEFKKEVKQRHVLGLFMALFILPILLDSAKASEHTLKSDDTTKDLKDEKKEGTTEEDLDEEKTKGGWEKLFELETVVANEVLKKRVVDLLVDVHRMTS